MLIRFAVENFLSFDEEVEFNMLSGNFKIHKEHLYKEKEGINLLRIAAIYGGNGAGKSNLVSAIDIAKDLIIKGTPNSKSNLPHLFFKLKKGNSKKPTKFEFEFKVNETIYSYGISFLKNRITEEWLYQTHPTKKDKLLFERETNEKGGTTIKLNNKFLKTSKDKLKAEIYAEELRANQPFLYEANEKDIEFVKEAFNWFEDILHVVDPSSKPAGLFENMILNKKFRDLTNQIIQKVDTGVKKIETQKIEINQLFGLHDKDLEEDILNRIGRDFIDVESLNDEIDYGFYLNEKGEPQAVKLIAKHKIGNEETSFDLIEESEGTQRFIELTPAFLDSLFKGKVYVVDELDRSMHTRMVKTLIEMYLSSDNEISKGQLIFTTHEMELLDLKLFRQDEIWFIEKNKSEASQMHSLSDFKPRYDKDIRRGYLQGRFDALPITDASALNF